jgi:hypothetical protein
LSLLKNDWDLLIMAKKDTLPTSKPAPAKYAFKSKKRHLTTTAKNCKSALQNSLAAWHSCAPSKLWASSKAQMLTTECMVSESAKDDAPMGGGMGGGMGGMGGMGDMGM